MRNVYIPTVIEWTALTIEKNAEVCSLVNSLSLANVKSVKDFYMMYNVIRFSDLTDLWVIR